MWPCGIIMALLITGGLSEYAFAESALPATPYPPLIQMRGGTVDSQIRCPASMDLVFKADDLSPACVRPSTVFILAERGWALKGHDSHDLVTGPPTRDYALAFLVNAASPAYNNTVGMIASHLKKGDYLIVEGISSSDPTVKVQELSSHVAPGVKVRAIAIYNTIRSLTSRLPTLPGGFDYIGYDYEKGSAFSPEFTTSEQSSIGFFDQARRSVGEYNVRTGSSAKLLIMPPYGELRNAGWDWGEAAKHADMIDIQLQAFVRDPQFFNYTLDALAQIKQEAPSTKAFVQISLVEKRGTASDNLDAINEIRALPLGGFFMFFHPNQTSEVSQFLKILPS